MISCNTPKLSPPLNPTWVVLDIIGRGLQAVASLSCGFSGHGRPKPLEAMADGLGFDFSGLKP